MTQIEWLFNESGNIEATLDVDGTPTVFELAPPKGIDVENVGVFAHNNPGNQIGAMAMCAVACLRRPKLTLDQLRQMDGMVYSEVAQAVTKFPVFNNGNK